MTNLVLLVGVPGCGKSTWAETFFDLKYSIVSSDTIRKRLAGSLKEAHVKEILPWDVFYEDIQTKLSHNVDVVADATFLTRKHRERARTVAAYTGADLHLVIFTNLFAAKDRNNERDEDAKVPAKVMHDMVELYWNALIQIDQEPYYKTVTRIEAFN